MQADTAGYGDPEHDPGLSIRRARIGLRGQHDWLDYQIRFGPSAPYDALTAANQSVGVVDAIAGGTFRIGPGDLRLSLGTEKVPYSREELISSRDLVFQERAVSTSWLTPGRELGVLVDYDLDLGLRLRAGVFNGYSNIFGDNNVGLMAAGRLEWAHGDTYVTATEGTAVGVGVAALHDADVATDTTGFSADALVRVGRLSLLTEATRNTLKPGDTTATTSDVFDPVVQQGLMAQLSWYQPLPTGGLEIASRFSVFDDAAGRADNGDVGILHTGATWRNLTDGLDLGVGYIHRHELQGVARPNDTVRMWVQVAIGTDTPARVEGEPQAEPPPDVAWTTRFKGTWTSSAPLEGAYLTLWQDEDELLSGTFHMTRPMGRVEVNQMYGLEAVDQDEDGRITLRIDPHDDGTDIVWFELKQDDEGLCGWSYEDGRREDAVEGRGGGAWLCWNPVSE